MTYRSFISTKKYKQIKKKHTPESGCVCCGSTENTFLLREAKLEDLYDKYGTDMVNKDEFKDCACLCRNCWSYTSSTLKKLALKLTKLI